MGWECTGSISNFMPNSSFMGLGGFASFDYEPLVLLYQLLSFQSLFRTKLSSYSHNLSSGCGTSGYRSYPSIFQQANFNGSYGVTRTGGSYTPSFNTNTVNTANVSNNNCKNLSWWISQGYNEEKGKQLAASGMKYCKIAKQNGVKGNCVGEVRKAINEVCYNGQTHYKRFGKAYQIGDIFLSNDKNFKKIDVSGMNLSPKDIPAGVIVLYGPGYSNGKGSYCGHGELSGGDGLGYSDCVTHLLKKKPTEIWIPV